MTRADKRKFHYIYKITRLDESDKYYVGLHSTDNLEDGYFGSGTLLSKSIKKHGKDKHTKEILEFLPTREALKLREKEIVNEELLGDKRCMNLKLGGEGGWDHVHKIGAHSKGTVNSNRSSKRLDNPEYHRRLSASQKKRGRTDDWRNDFTGSKHSDEVKAKIGSANSISQLGERNSQFGTCWVKKDGLSFKIKKQELDEYIRNGYTKGRIINAGEVFMDTHQSSKLK